MDPKTPTEMEVLSALRKLGGSAKAPDLIRAMTMNGFNHLEVARIIHRCLDHRSISLGRQLHLTVMEARNG